MKVKAYNINCEKSARETLLIFCFPGGVLIADFCGKTGELLPIGKIFIEIKKKGVAAA